MIDKPAILKKSLRRAQNSNEMEVIVRDLEKHALGQNCDQVYQYHEFEELLKCVLPPASGKKIRDILFITGNKNKVIELENCVDSKHVNFSILNIDLAEIQHSQILDIVQDKCERAFKHTNSRVLAAGSNKNNCPHDNKRADGLRCDKNNEQQEPEDGVEKERGETSFASTLVEDTCLNFKAFNGMPGPYVKWFLKAVGADGLYRMLEGFSDKTAEAVCIYALMHDPRQMIFFRGVARGRITAPRGSSWGWDPIFEEERTRMTFGEMDASLKSKFSHRANALTIFKRYLSATHNS